MLLLDFSKYGQLKGYDMTEKEIVDVIDWLTEVATPGSEWNQFYSDSEVEKVARDALEIVKQNTNIL